MDWDFISFELLTQWSLQPTHNEPPPSLSLELLTHDNNKASTSSAKCYLSSWSEKMRAGKGESVPPSSE